MKNQGLAGAKSLIKPQFAIELERPQTESVNSRRGLTLNQGLVDWRATVNGTQTRTCSVDGCDNCILARGWCSRHYARWHKYGDPMIARPYRVGGTCSIDGCDRRHKGHGYCGMHLKRFRAHGNVTEIGASGRPLKGEFPSWDAVHKRLSRERGLASAKACVDCGNPAREWSYNGCDPHALVGESSGFEMSYSLDLANYEPRCPSCHRKFDNAIRRGAKPFFEVTITKESK